MEKSETIKNIAKALITFHEHCEIIAKDSNNPFFKSKYASLSNIQESIRQPLKEAGLAYSQLPAGENELYTILIHAESGEYLQSCYAMKPVKDDPQGRGSCITYQKRYALAAILGLQIDDDDDANAASHPPRKQQQPDRMERKQTAKATPPPIDLVKLDNELKNCLTVDDLKLLKGTYMDEIKADVDIRKMFTDRYNYLVKLVEA